METIIVQIAVAMLEHTEIKTEQIQTTKRRKPKIYTNDCNLKKKHKN